MASVTDNRLSCVSIPSPSRAAGNLASSSRLGFGGFLHCACVCVTTANTGHECRLGDPCIDHVVVAAGMHIYCFVCGGIWVCGLKW
jgi:hypothetical protein